MPNNDQDVLSEDPALEQTIAEIARSRNRLHASLGELRQEITQLTDYEEWIRRHPLYFVGGALVIGYWFGSRGRR